MVFKLQKDEYDCLKDLWFFLRETYPDGIDTALMNDGCVRLELVEVGSNLFNHDEAITLFGDGFSSWVDEKYMNLSSDERIEIPYMESNIGVNGLNIPYAFLDGYLSKLAAMRSKGMVKAVILEDVFKYDFSVISKFEFCCGDVCIVDRLDFVAYSIMLKERYSSKILNYVVPSTDGAWSDECILPEGTLNAIKFLYEIGSYLLYRVDLSGTNGYSLSVIPYEDSEDYRYPYKKLLNQGVCPHTDKLMKCLVDSISGLSNQPICTVFAFENATKYRVCTSDYGVRIVMY